MISSQIYKKWTKCWLHNSHDPMQKENAGLLFKGRKRCVLKNVPLIEIQLFPVFYDLSDTALNTFCYLMLSPSGHRTTRWACGSTAARIPLPLASRLLLSCPEGKEVTAVLLSSGPLPNLPRPDHPRGLQPPLWKYSVQRTELSNSIAPADLPTWCCQPVGGDNHCLMPP